MSMFLAMISFTNSFDAVLCALANWKHDNIVNATKVIFFFI